MLNIIGLTIPVSIATGRVTEKKGIHGFDVRPARRIYTMPPFRRLVNTTPPILTRGGLNVNLFARRWTMVNMEIRLKDVIPKIPPEKTSVRYPREKLVITPLVGFPWKPR